MERATTINFTMARARSRAIATAINREEALLPTFARASQNVAAAVTLLDTLPVPSMDRADKVYCQLKDIHSVTTA
jgi:hypothetical protein